MPWISIIAPEAYVDKFFEDVNNKWKSYYGMKVKKKTKEQYWKMPEYTTGDLKFSVKPRSIEDWKKLFEDLTGVQPLNLRFYGRECDIEHFVPGGTPITPDNPWVHLILCEEHIIQESNSND